MVSYIEELSEEDKLLFRKEFEENGEYSIELEGKTYKIEKNMIVKMTEI